MNLVLPEDKCARLKQERKQCSSSYCIYNITNTYSIVPFSCWLSRL